MMQRLEALNAGLVECRTLTELVGVDFSILLPNVFTDLMFPSEHMLGGITKRMAAAGQVIYQSKGLAALDVLCGHSSDLVRGWGPYVMAASGLPLPDALPLVKPFATDANAGVREWAWLALRPAVAGQINQVLTLLAPWTKDPNERIRRFAVEITRPRGVWCGHIAKLKQEPWIAADFLETLKADPAKYVQLSVGNWLNDASKSHPAWVQQWCQKWQQSSSSQHTNKICKRALRTLLKKP